jgi:cytochrome c oxidase subunit I+III
MHVTGLMGMPRRVWTYPETLGWADLNLLSTIGAYILAGGVAVFILDLVRNFRMGNSERSNPWDAGTLEFLPNDVYSTRSIPHITSREPVWDNPDLAREVEAGEHYLPNAPTGGRETIITSPVEAEPQYVIQMPGPGWMHVLGAAFMAGFFLLLTIKAVTLAIISGILSICCVLVWVWSIDKGPDKGPVDIGAGIRLPVYVTGPMAHGWWAMIILMVVAGSLYLAYLFSYLYMWTVSPEAWAEGRPMLPQVSWPLLSLAGFAASVVAFVLARRSLGPKDAPRLWTPILIFAGTALSAAGLAAEIWAHWSEGLRPVQSSYAALVYFSHFLTGQLVFAVLVMSGYVIARHFTGRLDKVRWASLENTSLLAYYTAAQALLGLIVVHGFPRVAGLP